MLLRRVQLPTSARKQRSIKMAQEFLLEAFISRLPVDPFALFAHHGWLLYSCADAEMIYGARDPFNVKKHGADARTLRSRTDGIYVTVYDETRYPDRIRWTLAHEIGHIWLGHLTDFEATSLSRGGLTNEQYLVLEREANCFAAELLMPMVVIRELPFRAAVDIARLCQVSCEAARNRLKELLWWSNGPPTAMQSALKAQFNDFLVTTRPDACSTDITHESPGSAMKPLQYQVIATDDNGRFTVCPRCGNADISKYACYCKMCGLYLYNDCGVSERQRTANCGKRNAGDARYCEYCGAETPLFRMGLLPPWQAWQDDGSPKHRTVAADDRKQADSLFGSVGRMNRARS